MPTKQHKDWREYPGETVSERATEAFKDGHRISLEQVVAEVDHQYWALEERIAKLEDALDCRADS